jgi:S-adenosylmethionine synthetase
LTVNLGAVQRRALREHVVDAGLTARRQIREGLGGSQAHEGGGSEDDFHG